MKSALKSSHPKFNTQVVETQVLEDVSFLANLLGKVAHTDPGSKERITLEAQLALGFSWVLKRVELGCYDVRGYQHG